MPPPVSTDPPAIPDAPSTTAVRSIGSLNSGVRLYRVRHLWPHRSQPLPGAIGRWRGFLKRFLDGVAACGPRLQNALAPYQPGLPADLGLAHAALLIRGLGDQPRDLPGTAGLLVQCYEDQIGAG